MTANIFQSSFAKDGYILLCSWALGLKIMNDSLAKTCGRLFYFLEDNIVCFLIYDTTHAFI